MPQVDITLAEGRSPGQIRDLMHQVHAAVLRTTNTRPEYVRIVVHEVPGTHWSTGDVTLAEMRAADTSAAGAGPSTDDTTDRRSFPDTENQE
ncbi:tautomerase family protein [Nocardiopsis sp. MG754419]|uniref:tautomerase family protein n=1 Tax=Nocardiopsis sp. MG754419 TaxID=2259865 RepID=UPI001BA9ACE9|nr:tautomerase family protein [Nocardiopsis sp. MG754419]MBR8743524.1 4-oxalocrotonate tautomerase [Nocardiopsis sp. MG754419]